jgi:hypothetical protein
MMKLLILILTLISVTKAQRQPGICPQDCNVVSVCGSGTSSDLRFLSCVCTETYLNGFERCASLCLELDGGVSGYDIRTVCIGNGFLPSSKAIGSYFKGINKPYLPVRGPTPTKKKTAASKKPLTTSFTQQEEEEDDEPEQIDLPIDYQPLPTTNIQSTQSIPMGAIIGIVTACLVAISTVVGIVIALSKRKSSTIESPIGSTTSSRSSSLYYEKGPRTRKSKSSQSTCVDSIVSSQVYPGRLYSTTSQIGSIVSVPVLTFEEAFPEEAQKSRL